jgi:hypothetical protein
MKKHENIIDNGKIPGTPGVYRVRRKGGIDAVALFPDGKVFTARGTHRSNPWMPCWNFIEVTWDEYRSLEERKAAKGGSLSLLEGILFLDELRKRARRKSALPLPFPG